MTEEQSVDPHRHVSTFETVPTRLGHISACEHEPEEHFSPDRGVQSRAEPHQQTSSFNPSKHSGACKQEPDEQTRPVLRVQTLSEHKQAARFKPGAQSSAVISHKHL